MIKGTLLKVYHLIARNPHGVLVQLLSGLIAYLLLGIYFHQRYGQSPSLERLRQLRWDIRHESQTPILLHIYLVVWPVALAPYNSLAGDYWKSVISKERCQAFSNISVDVPLFCHVANSLDSLCITSTNLSSDSATSEWIASHASGDPTWPCTWVKCSHIMKTISQVFHARNPCRCVNRSAGLLTAVGPRFKHRLNPGAVHQLRPSSEISSPLR